jgi:hypothetical protein
MEYRSLLFFFWGLGPFQVVFGVENGLSIVHFSQVSTQAKISSFKNPHIKIDLLLPRGPKSLKLVYSIMNLKHNILALVGKANKISSLCR